MFEVHTQVTRESCRAQARASLVHHVREIYILSVGLALAMAILYAIHSPKAHIAAIAFALVMAYDFLAVPVNAVRLYASRNMAVKRIVVRFAKKSMRITTGVEDTYVGYDKITYMAENSGYFILYASHHAPVVFRKSEVLDLRADELKAFLEAKTGRSFRPFRG